MQGWKLFTVNSSGKIAEQLGPASNHKNSFLQRVLRAETLQALHVFYAFSSRNDSKPNILG